MKAIGWFAAGCVAGACGLGGVMLSAAVVHRPPTPAMPTLRSIAPELADAVEASDAWAAKWPTLQFPAAPDRVPGNYEREYDRYDNETAFRAHFVRERAPSLVLWTLCEGDVQHLPTPPPTVYVTVYDSDRSVSGRIVFIADGERITTINDRDDFGSASADLRTEDFLKIARASKVECRLNGVEEAMDEFDLRRMRMLASRMVPPG